MVGKSSWPGCVCQADPLDLLAPDCTSWRPGWVVEPTIGAAVPCGLLAECAGVVVVPRCCTYSTLLGEAAYLGGVSVLQTVVALHEPAVPMVKLALFELALEEEPLVDQGVCLCRRCYVDDQV